MKQTHYNEAYFHYQKSAGLLSAKANRFLFEPFISINDNVVDFGSGGGYFLFLIKCRNKIGVEINEVAKKASNELGIETVTSPSQLQNNWADVMISSHALEHCADPLNILKSLKPKLKKGGKFVLVVPCEKKVKYKPNDINQHLFTWSEMNLGNLFNAAGYRVDRVEELRHRYPPYSNKIMSLFGEKVFHVFAKIYGLLRTNVTQIRIVAING